jgi:hypothetical protein
MNHPRDNAVLPSPDATFNFGGFVTNPGESITLQIKDQSDGSWDTRTTTTSLGPSQGQSDGSLTWFQFGRDTTLPYGSSSSQTKYWRFSTAGFTRRMIADVRGVGASSGILASFDVGADACINAQTSGANILANCQSSNSPVARVIAPCGRQNAACCLAQGVSAANRCDHGFACNTSTNRCTITTGGLNEACNANGTCDNNGLACSAGTCKSTLIERAPVLRAELVVHTCNTSSAPSSTLKSVRIKDQEFFLDRPGTDTVRNTDTTWGISPDDFDTLADLDRITLWSEGDDAWCFDRVDLVVNGTRIFRKSFPNGVTIEGSGLQFQFTVANEQELRDAVLASNANTLCALPASLTFAAFTNLVTGKMGHIFGASRRNRTDLLEEARRFDAWWGSGSATVTQLNSNTARINLGFRVRHDDSGLEGTATVRLNAKFACDAEVEQTGVCPVGSPCEVDIDDCSNDFDDDLTIVSVSVDADTILPLLNDIVEGFGVLSLYQAISNELSNFSSFEGIFNEAEAEVCDALDPSLLMCDQEGDLCGCPGLTMSSTGVTFDWTRFGPNNVNLNFVPTPLCL